MCLFQWESLHKIVSLNTPDADVLVFKLLDPVLYMHGLLELLM